MKVYLEKVKFDQLACREGRVFVPSRFARRRGKSWIFPCVLSPAYFQIPGAVLWHVLIKRCSVSQMKAFLCQNVFLNRKGFPVIKRFWQSNPAISILRLFGYCLQKVSLAIKFKATQNETKTLFPNTVYVRSGFHVLCFISCMILWVPLVVIGVD